MDDDGGDDDAEEEEEKEAEEEEEEEVALAYKECCETVQLTSLTHSFSLSLAGFVND